MNQEVTGSNPVVHPLTYLKFDRLSALREMPCMAAEFIAHRRLTGVTEVRFLTGGRHYEE